MIKRILVILLLFPCLSWAGFSVDGVTDPASVDGVSEPASVDGVDSNYGPPGFCSGSELFCATFETDAEITWDSTPGAEDCDGYDTDGDWCDYDSSRTLVGSYCFGIRGNYTQYCIKSLGGTYSEFYVELFIQIDTSRASTYGRFIYDVTAGDYCLGLAWDPDSFVIQVNSRDVDLDTGVAMSEDTTYHIGVYYKKETGSNDGVVRIWVKEGTDDFVGSDLKYNSSAVDTGDFDGEAVYLGGNEAADEVFYDNVKVVSGEPSWPTS